MAKAEHLELLRKGVVVWNQWRMEERSIRPDLSETNLGGMNLNLVDFQDADLRKSILDNTQLDSAVLDGADLSLTVS
jgi:hypothetical protein